MKKIAVIDSGSGGLTVAKEIIALLPHEEIIYVGDHGNCPYGDKSEKEIKQHVDNIIVFLSQFDIKVLVLACNTATSIYLNDLEGMLPYPVIGVIEPGVIDAIHLTKNKNIGVIATNKTIETHQHKKEIKKLNKNANVVELSCPKLVPLIERNEKDLIYLALTEYLYHFEETNIDCLILGCTHYPLIEKEIKNILKEKVMLINPAKTTTRMLKSLLENHDKLEKKSQTNNHYFFTTGDTKQFDKSIKEWTNLIVHSRKVIIQQSPLQH